MTGAAPAGDPELEAMIDIARQAAARVMEIRRGGDIGLTAKGPDDPVTRADREANELIVTALALQLPFTSERSITVCSDARVKVGRR